MQILETKMKAIGSNQLIWSFKRLKSYKESHLILRKQKSTILATLKIMKMISLKSIRRYSAPEVLLTTKRYSSSQIKR